MTLYVHMVIDCSHEDTGQMDSESIECSAVRISDSRRVTIEMLKRAFNTIVSQLPSVVIPNSSIISGMHLHFIHLHISIVSSALYVCIHIRESVNSLCRDNSHSACTNKGL